MFRRILVPLDGSPTANRGLDAAIALAKNQSARLCLVHVVDELVVTQGLNGTMYVPPGNIEDLLSALRASGEKLLRKAGEKIRQRRIRFDTALIETAGHRVADLIVKQAKKWHADVIVLGTHGRRGLSRVVMGSDAEMIVREAPVPVLLVRSPRRRSYL